jgi:hypothetical protein
VVIRCRSRSAVEDHHVVARGILKPDDPIDDDWEWSRCGGSGKETVMHEHPTRLDDHAAHRRALDLLARLVGEECTAHVCWDLDHHLQGHVDVDGQHLVLIAPRDDEHAPLVLTEDDWDALRRGCSVPV